MEKELPLVSVIMSIFSEKERILDLAIQSIINQTYQKLQIILILDNPTNMKIKSYLQRIAQLDKRVEVLYNGQNLGLANSLNRGIAASKGKYIARMDADDISYLNRIEHQVSYAEKNNIDILGMSIQMIDEKGNKYGSPVVYPSKEKHLKILLKTKSCLAHPTWLVKTDIYKKLNGYRNIAACEDYDFLLRASREGYVLANMKEVGLLYRKNTNSISNTNRILQIINFNLLRKNKDINEKEIIDFIDTKKGKNEYKKIEKYFGYLDKYKNGKKEKKWSAIINILFACVFTPRGRIILWNKLYTKLINQLEKKNV